MNNLFSRNKTFRPNKKHSYGTKRYDLHKHAQATLGKCVVHILIVRPNDETRHDDCCH